MSSCTKDPCARVGWLLLEEALTAFLTDNLH